MAITHGPSGPDRAVEARRVALAGGIGTTIEWYDFFIYGTAAAVVFAPQFFPQVSDLAGTLAAFGTFAIGFIARPLGGISEIRGTFEVAPASWSAGTQSPLSIRKTCWGLRKRRLRRF